MCSSVHMLNVTLFKKLTNSDNICKVPRQHLAWRIHLMGSHSPFPSAYDLGTGNNQTQALDVSCHL